MLLEQAELAEEREIFSAGGRQQIVHAATTCRELLTLHSETAVVINNKKLDLLKVKVLRRFYICMCTFAAIVLGGGDWHVKPDRSVHFHFVKLHVRVSCTCSYLMFSSISCISSRTYLQFLLEARKIKLLSELQTIYPIERLENGEYAIRGVELPADL